MAEKRACCDIVLGETGFRLSVRDLDALDRLALVTKEVPFAWEKQPNVVGDFLSHICAEFDEIATRAFLPESVVIRGIVNDSVPERLREAAVLGETSALLNIAISDLHATFLPGRHSRHYVLTERNSIREIETYPLFNFLEVSIVCVPSHIEYNQTILLHLLAPIPFVSISLSRLLSLSPPYRVS